MANHDCASCAGDTAKKEIAMVTMTEAAWDRAEERHFKEKNFLKKIIIALIALLVLSNLIIIGIFTYERLQYDYASYEAITDQGGDAKIYGNDGDVYDGDSEAENKNEKNS
jgi:hypothetical protein